MTASFMGGPFVGGCGNCASTLSGVCDRPPYLQLPEFDQSPQGLLCGGVGADERGGASLVGHGAYFSPREPINANQLCR